MIQYSIVHHVPGRIRLQIPSLKRLAIKTLMQLAEIRRPKGILIVCNPLIYPHFKCQGNPIALNGIEGHLPCSSSATVRSIQSFHRNVTEPTSCCKTTMVYFLHAASFLPKDNFNGMH
jgi:hypothetical protein